jgi:hypothetical protein
MSGSITPGITAPNAMVITPATAQENSRSANYDSTAKVWLADEFSSQLTALSATTTRSIADLHEQLYLGVPGSHVTASGPRFGDLSTITIGEFVTP